MQHVNHFSAWTSLLGLCCYSITRNRNRKLEISTAPTKANSREPAYSQALVQNKIDRQRVRQALVHTKFQIQSRLFLLRFFRISNSVVLKLESEEHAVTKKVPFALQMFRLQCE